MKSLLISGAEFRSGTLLKYRRYDGKTVTIVRNGGAFAIYIGDVCIADINGNTKLIEAIRTADCF